MLSPLLYSLYTHDCAARHNSNIIVKFTDDTVVVGLITNNDEWAYLQEVSDLTTWCKDISLLLNGEKTKEMVVDFCPQCRRTYNPLLIDRTPVERVSSFKYLGVHISQDLSWTVHTDTVVKYTTRCTNRARRIIKDPHHPCNRLFVTLRSGRHLRCHKTRTNDEEQFFPCGDQSPELCTLNKTCFYYILLYLLYLFYSIVFYLHCIIFLSLLKLSTEVQYMSQKHFTVHPL